MVSSHLFAQLCAVKFHMLQPDNMFNVSKQGQKKRTDNPVCKCQTQEKSTRYPHKTKIKYRYFTHYLITKPKA